MKAIGVNGSPRKKWNTATLLDKALQGARGLCSHESSFKSGTYASFDVFDCGMYGSIDYETAC